MKHLRNLVGACLSAALAVACGGGNVPSSSTLTSISPVQPPPGSRTLAVFKYSGAAQKFVVPKGVTELTIILRGASGGGAASGSYEAAPGLGGGLKATIPVTPGERLFIYVGGEGGADYGGFNGGGTAGIASGYSGFGGGGASDVRQGGNALSNRVLVAAGGGGQGSESYYYYGGGAGGSGGGKTGGAGVIGGGQLKFSPPGYGGNGGTQNAGGSGGQGGIGSGSGCSGPQGDMGSSGAGGDGGAARCGYSGGGGGGGYYGGGGGGGSGVGGYRTTSGSGLGSGGGGGGGGGSSYAESGAIRVVYHQGVWGPGNGEVVIHRSP
jgi:hypothetical protein